MKTKSKMLFCTLVVFSTPCAHAAMSQYPPVQPAQWTFYLPHVSTAKVAVTINARSGVPLYRLACHPGGYSNGSNFNYSGDFECRLTSAELRSQRSILYSTLLTEDAYQDKDWESRGRYFAAELEPPCAQIPQFGTVRTFRLRGMKLTLRIANPIVVTGTLKSLTLHIEVRPDPSAQREIAAIVGFPKGTPSECLRYFPDPKKFVTPKLTKVATGRTSSVYKISWGAPAGVWAANPYPRFYVMESSTDATFRKASRITTIDRYYIAMVEGKPVVHYYRVRICYIVPRGKKGADRGSARIVRGLPYSGYYDTICSAWTDATAMNDASR